MADGAHTRDEERALLEKAALKLQKVNREIKEIKDAQHEPLAVLGMACRFPGNADSPEAFWQLLAHGGDAIGDLTERWKTLHPHRPMRANAVHWAGLLSRVDGFDAEFFGLSPREAGSTDPQQRMLLQVAWEAFERAGLPPEALAGSRTSVYVGQSFHDYEYLLVNTARQADPYALTGNIHSFAAGRLSYIFGLQGPCLTLDTACSSSLAAVHLACQSLRSQESDVALAAGVNLILDPASMEMMQHTGALAPDGRCKTFDARANGYVRGEGCGVLILKRLRDAVRDGDPVVALIRGSAVNQDGASAGLTTPSLPAQVAVIRQALHNARVEAEAIECIEAHGTGTPLGDPIEIEALRQVFGGPRSDGKSIAIGSVKTNIGHLEAAAGMASLFKAILMLQHEHMAPHRNFEALNPMIRLDGSPFTIPTTLQPWKRHGAARLCGVSGFAMSGTNAHVVVQEAPSQSATPPSEARCHMLPISGRSAEALRANAQRFRDHLQHTVANPEDLAYTAGVRRAQHPHRLVVLGDTTAQWADALGAYLENRPHPNLIANPPREGPPGGVVLVFSGQGGQWLGMGRQLATEPVFLAALQACDAAVQACGGPSVLNAWQAAQPPMDRIDVVQPLLFAVQVALAALWRAWGLVPAAIVGHSMGEVAAAHVAGALSLADAARVITLRSQLMRAVAGRGAMLAVNMTPQEAERLDARLTVAVINGPQSVVLSGDASHIETLRERLHNTQQFYGRVKTDVAFHSAHMDALVEPLRQGLAGLQPQAHTTPWISTVTGAPLHGSACTAAYWARNLREPVHLSAAMAEAFAMGHTTVVEVAPHAVLGPAIASMLPAQGVCVASLRRDAPDRHSMLTNLAQLHTHGVSVNFAKQHPHARQVQMLPTYAFAERAHWLPTPSAAALLPARAKQPGAHPWLGTRMALSAGVNVWESTLQAAQVPWLGDHKVGDAVVFPAAGFVDLALAATREVLGVAHPELREVQLREALIVRPDSPPLMQLLVDPAAQHAVRVQISTFSDNAWTLHAVAHAQTPQAKQQPTPAPSVAGTALDHQAVYARLAQADLNYGKQFRGVVTAVVAEHTAQGSLRAPTDAAGVMVHPALLDAGLQVAGLHALHMHGGSAPWLPVGLARLHLSGSTTGVTACRVVHHPQPDPGVWQGDVQFLDSRDMPLITLAGLRLQRLAPSNKVHQAAHTDSVLTTHWETLPALREADLRNAHGERWLLVGDRGGLGLALQRCLMQRGVDAVLLPAGSAPSNAHGTYRGVVYLGALDGPPTLDTDPVVTLAQAQAACCDAPMRWIQSMVQQRFRDVPRLWLVTAGAQAVANTPPTAPLQAMAWGMARSVAYEHPLMRTTRIDVALSADAVAQAALAESLAQEIVAQAFHDELALRPGTRYAARLVRGMPALQARPTWRADATYLITGGLGGLGLALAEHLVQHGVRHLLLLARRSPSAAQQARIEQLQRSGAQVCVGTADVTDVAQLQTVVDTMRSSMPPVRGVVHASGVVDDALVGEQTPERVARVLVPKVLGAAALQQLLHGEALDFMVLYSSAAGFLGSPGQSNYAAANACMDALAACWRAQGTPVTSLAWGPFAEVGMAAAESQRGARLTQRGMRPLTVQQGHSFFDMLVRSSVPQVAVVPLNTRQWVESYPWLATSSVFAPLLHDAQSHAAPAQVRERLLQAPPLARADLLQSFLYDEIAHVLRIEAQQVGHDTPFKSLGMDSLLGLELRNRLEAALGLQLSATLIWVHATPAALRNALLKALAQNASHDAPQDTAPAAPTPGESSGDADVDALVAELQREVAWAKKRERHG